MQILVSHMPAPPPRQDSGFGLDSEFSIRVCLPRTFPILPPQPSRSFKPSPVEVVPPRSPRRGKRISAFSRCGLSPVAAGTAFVQIHSKLAAFLANEDN
jgi:hypothetical protein